METDISRKRQVEKDAKLLEDMASYLREFADVDLIRLRDWERLEMERGRRARIKLSMEVLLHNLPC